MKHLVVVVVVLFLSSSLTPRFVHLPPQVLVEFSSLVLTWREEKEN